MKIKRPALILCCMMLMIFLTSTSAIAASAWDGKTIASSFSGGLGTKESPYEVSTGAELAYLAAVVNNETVDESNGKPYAKLYYVLMADIDLAGYEWTPIGNTTWDVADNAGGFAGGFEGNSHIITGLSISKDYNYSGLFGRTANGSFISNIIIEGKINHSGESYYDFATRYAGGLVGQNCATISNCIAKADILGTTNSIGGGLVGENANFGQIISCSTMGTVSGDFGSINGGLVGRNYGYIENSSAAVKITNFPAGSSSRSYNGGLVGDNNNMIINCYATGEVFSSGEKASNGGLVGRNLGGTYGVGDATFAVIQNSYSSSNITSEGENSYNGGLVGINYDFIINSYTNGTITGPSSSNGGLVGWNYDYIGNCYSLSNVSGAAKSYNGGLVGWQIEDAYIENCYAIGVVSAAGSGGFSGIIAGWKKEPCYINNVYYDGSTQQSPYGTINGKAVDAGDDQASEAVAMTIDAIHSRGFVEQLNKNASNNKYDTGIIWLTNAGESPTLDTSKSEAILVLGDIYPSDWFYDDAKYCYFSHVLGWTSGDVFKPNEPLDRKNIATVFAAFSSLMSALYDYDSPFDDVDRVYPYKESINWAVETGIIEGVGNNKFAPEREVTREEIATIFIRYVEAMDITLPKVADAITFADDSSISGWAKDAVTQMVQAGILKGKNGNLFDPTGTITKAEMSAIIHRLGELIQK